MTSPTDDLITFRAHDDDSTSLLPTGGRPAAHRDSSIALKPHIEAEMLDLGKAGREERGFETFAIKTSDRMRQRLMPSRGSRGVLDA